MPFAAAWPEIEQLEQPGIDQESDGDAGGRLGLRSLDVEKQRDDRPAGDDQREHGAAGIADGEGEGRPAGARDSGPVARAIGEADPHRRRHAEAERHHERDGRDLDGDRVRGERVGADQPHQEGGGIEDRHLEAEGQRDRQSDPPDLTEAFPVGPPEPAEEEIAAKPTVRRDDDRESEEHEAVGRRRADPGALETHGRNAEAAEHQPVDDRRVDRDRRPADPHRGQRPFQRRDEIAEHDEGEKRQGPPLQGAEILPALVGEVAAPARAGA